VTAALALDRACAHCSLPIPAGIAGAYCCTGCEVVHGAIGEMGLERFYALRETAAPAQTTAHAYTELDDPAFARRHVQAATDGRARAALYLEDLRCTACAWLVEATPRCLPGVTDVRVDIGRARADVTWDPARTSLAAIARHLDRLGHPVHPYRGLDREQQRRREDRALLVKLGIAGAAVGNLMLLAIALYAGLFQGMSAAYTTFFRWASMVIAVPALAFSASPMFKTALGALRARRLHLDLPLSIGILAGLVWGAANVIRGVGEIYFDSLAMLVFLLLVARWIVLRHQRRASSAAELLLALIPRRTRRLDPATGATEDVPLEAIVLGDLIEVRANETIPVDGVIERGTSAIDAGLLTGESRPTDVGLGTTVHAGTVNLAAPIVVRASAVGEQTRVGALVTTIEGMSARKAPIERLVDRIAGTFVQVVTLTALLIFIGWSFVSPALGAEHAMALLIVTCPCALALATPLAVTVALGRAARKGILIKGADALERLATPGTLVIDKTGTLTAGKLAVVSWHGDLDARVLAASVEAASAHPIAVAIAASVEKRRPVRDVREELGRGMRGTVGDRTVVVGAPAWVRKQCPRAGSGDVERWIEVVARRGQTPIAVGVDGAIVAIAGLADPIRPDARAALAALANRGWTVEILSGDDQRVVSAVGAELGLAPARCTGETSPEGKLAYIQDVRSRGPVVMVGDGVNDAAAIAAATCGIAVSGAAEIAIEAADVYVKTPSIGAIAAIADGAHETLRTIRRSLRFSLAYNTTAGLLAVTGLIHPLIGALLMPLSSLTVLASSLRSRAFRGTP
jgi:Cu2+-exporting ATPase